MSLEVQFQSITERVPPHHKYELLEQTSPFPIRDPIYQRLRHISRFTLSLYVMIRWLQIIIESPSLIICEMQPCFILVFLYMLAAERARVVGEGGGETLVEPEVVPPLHGHEVAEPHVR